jgi:hypothetical protein
MSEPQTDEYEVRVVRTRHPITAFSLTFPLVRWIDERAKAEGMSKSAFVRRVLDEERQRQEESAA